MFNKILLVGMLILAACGSAPQEETSTNEVSQALLVTEPMHVQPMTLQMVAPKGRTSEDPAHPTPNLTLVTWVVNTGACSTYSTTAKMAIVCVSTAQFNAVNADLAAAFADPTHHHVDVSVTYDNSGTLTNKPITSWTHTLI